MVIGRTEGRKTAAGLKVIRGSDVNIYELKPDELGGLDQSEFVDMVNHLIRAEASRRSIPPSGIHTNLRVNEPDAGIDARVDAPLSHESQWVPSGVSVWQVKSANVYPGELRDEAGKPGVLEAVASGGTYCIAIGVDYGDDLRQSREKALRDRFLELGLPARYRLYSASDLAAWASEIPAIVLLPQFDHPIGGLTRWAAWEQHHLHGVPFQSDPRRAEIMQQIRRSEKGEIDLSHLRLEGQSGVGKTRLALESFRATSASERLLYAYQPDDVPPPFFSWMEANSAHSAILVVDECDKKTGDYLHGQSARSGGRVLLVTIGPGRPPDHTRSPPEGVLVLERMNEDQIRAVVEAASSTLYPQAVDFIIRVSGGFVKLATALARAMMRDPSLMSAADLSRVYDVDHILTTLIPGHLHRRTMKAIALLSRVGWEREVASEGQIVTEFAGVAWPQAQDAVNDMVYQGYVAKQGRYRYVTPHLLAVWLALEVWEARGEEILGLLPKLPTPSSRRALLERVSDLGETEVARRVAEELLSDTGLFPDIDALDEAGRSEVLGMLTMAAPEAGLRALERILLHLPRDRLLSFAKGRRHTVWTLERLAWHPETFVQAARVLLRLAEAENEPYSNNATGVWSDLFQTRLGGTSVPALERHRVLAEALSSESPEVRRLAVLGIAAALRTREMRSADSEYQRGRVVPAEWTPHSWEEEWQARRSALGLLDTCLSDGDTEISAEARAILVQSARGLVRIGLANEVLQRIDATPVRDENEAHELWRLLQQILDRESTTLSDSQRARAEQIAYALVGDSYHDRLRRWVGQGSPIDYRDLKERGLRQEDMAAKMAEEGFQNPSLLGDELDWLASPEARLVHAYGRRLGELDHAETWLPELVERVKAGASPGLLGTYLRGRSDSGGCERVHDLLDTWAQDSGMARVSYEITWRLQPGERAARRAARLVDNGWIPPGELSRLAWGRWPQAVSIETYGLLLERLSQCDNIAATEAGLRMLLQWLEEYPDDADELASEAWAFLERPGALGERRGSMTAFYWQNVAARYVPKDPRRVASVILRFFEASEVVTLESDERMEVLREALLADPEGVWEQVGEQLLREDEVGFRLRLSLRRWGVEVVGTDTLLEWADRKSPSGPRILAKLAIPLSSLARALLIRYPGDESVGGALTATFLSGSWWGPESAWLESKLATAREWCEVDDPAIQEWARELKTMIEETLKRVRLAEEEEFLRQ
jgi:hypothetical protein